MTDPVDFTGLPRGVKVDKPRLLNYGGPLKAGLGGPTLNIQRLGTRHAIDITLPVMPTEPTGREWAARLSMALLYGAVVPWRQDGLAIGLPGTPVVDGGGQAGTTLVLRGFRGGYTVRLGQAFSLVGSATGRRYLHFVAAGATAASDGTLALAIYPMLRIQPADGDTCEFALPRIQGSLSGNEMAFTRMTAPFTDFGTITVTEDE